MQKSLDVELKDVVIWHDVINTSITWHTSNGFRSLSVTELLTILNQLEGRLRALVYCQRDWTPNTVEKLKSRSIIVLQVEKNFVSSRKQKCQGFMKQICALHESPELQLKHLHILLRNDCDPQKSCPNWLIGFPGAPVKRWRTPNPWLQKRETTWNCCSDFVQLRCSFDFSANTMLP